MDEESLHKKLREGYWAAARVYAMRVLDTSAHRAKVGRLYQATSSR